MKLLENIDCVWRCGSEIVASLRVGYWFWEGKESVADYPRASRPASMKNKENVRE